MIVYDCHIIRVAVSPGKANSPLLIDPDTELPLPIASQSFQPIAGGDPKIVESARAMYHDEFSVGNSQGLAERKLASPVLKQRMSLLTGKRQDHAGIL